MVDPTQFGPGRLPPPTTEPGIARAGDAAAARRRQLDISQRSLAEAGVINAGALIAFEKGRSWPRASTRDKLEDILQWPRGALVALRDGQPAPSDERSTEVLRDTAGVPILAQAVEIALNTVAMSLDTLPPPAAPEYRERAARLLTELRNIESLAVRAARVAQGSPTVTVLLSRARRLQRPLVLAVGDAAGASLGQRTTAARTRADLTVEETAAAAGVATEVVEAAEAGRPVDPRAAARIESFLSAFAAG